MPELPPVLILFNEPGAAAVGAIHAESDAGVLEEVAAVRAALAELGVPVREQSVRCLEDLTAVLAGAREPVVFNLVEALSGPPADVNAVPAVCRAFGKAVTGAPSPALDLCLDKWRTKAVLRAAGLPVAADQLVLPGQAVDPARLPAGPLIVKPAATDASEGIEASGGIFAGPGPELDAAVARLHRQFRQPVLIERMVGHREFNAAVLQDGDGVRVLTVAEIDFSAFPPDKPRVVDYAAKWLEGTFEYNHTPRLIPAPVSPAMFARLEAAARAAWQATGCQGLARVDFRGSDDEFWILEVNPNPDIAPGAGYAAAVAASGLSYAEFVRSLVRQALAERPAFLIRRTLPADRDAILEFTRETGYFRPDEVDIAREVLDDAIANEQPGEYESLTCEMHGRPVGWICHGPTPCTIGTYDIYWIVVAKEVQGKGVGRRLMQQAEALIAAAGGRLAVIETAGQPLYESTRGFYLKVGYLEAARVADFYGPGDAKVMYTKALPAR